jgi:hypothetical protein
VIRIWLFILESVSVRGASVPVIRESQYERRSLADRARGQNAICASASIYFSVSCKWVFVTSEIIRAFVLCIVATRKTLARGHLSEGLIGAYKAGRLTVSEPCGRSCEKADAQNLNDLRISHAYK